MAWLLELLQRMGRTPDQQCSICYEDLDTTNQFISPFAADAGLQTAVAPAVIDGCWHRYHMACIWEFYQTQTVASARCPMCGPIDCRQVLTRASQRGEEGGLSLPALSARASFERVKSVWGFNPKKEALRCPGNLVTQFYIGNKPPGSF